MSLKFGGIKLLMSMQTFYESEIKYFNMNKDMVKFTVEEKLYKCTLRNIFIFKTCMIISKHDISN